MMVDENPFGHAGSDASDGYVAQLDPMDEVMAQAAMAEAIWDAMPRWEQMEFYGFDSQELNPEGF